MRRSIERVCIVWGVVYRVPSRKSTVDSISEGLKVRDLRFVRGAYVV